MFTQNLKVAAEDNQKRLDIFLTKELSDIGSRSFLKKLIDAGRVKLNKKVVKAHHKVAEGDEVFVEVPDEFLEPQDLEPQDIALDIFYEDEYLLVVNKPPGMLVHPAAGIYKGTLVNALLFHCAKLSEGSAPLRQGIVHRLDQETSGLMVVAKDNKTHSFLANQFAEHTVKKCYWAIVDGKVEFDEGMIEAPLGRDRFHREKKAVLFDDSAKYAMTTYRVRKRFARATLVELFPKTGRTHQLRVHMSYLRHPVLGDEKYGRHKNFSRLALHAKTLGFLHPKTKRFIEFTCRPPKEFLIYGKS